MHVRMYCAKGDMGAVEVSDHAVLHGWVGVSCVCVCVSVVWVGGVNSVTLAETSPLLGVV